MSDELKCPECQGNLTPCEVPMSDFGVAVSWACDGCNRGWSDSVVRWYWRGRREGVADPWTTVTGDPATLPPDGQAGDEIVQVSNGAVRLLFWEDGDWRDFPGTPAVWRRGAHWCPAPGELKAKADGGELARLRETVESLRQYASDTLTEAGNAADQPMGWWRDAVREILSRCDWHTAGDTQ